MTKIEERMLQSLKRAKALIDVALPKFDWGKSPLSSEAIRLLNEVPGEVDSTIAEAERIKAGKSRLPVCICEPSPDDGQVYIGHPKCPLHSIED